MPTDTFKPPTQQDPATAEWEQDFFDIHGRRAGQVDYDDWQWSQKFVELEGRPITREDWQRHYFEDKSLGQRLTSPGAKYSSVPEFAPRLSRIEGDMPADQWLEITPDPWYTTMDISTPEGRFRQFDAWDQQRNQHARGTPEYDLITLSMNQLMTAGPGSAPWQFNFSRRQGMRDEIDELTKNLTDEQRVAFIDDWVDSKLALGINPYSFNHPNVQMAPAIAATIQQETASAGDERVVEREVSQPDFVPVPGELPYWDVTKVGGGRENEFTGSTDTVMDAATNERVLVGDAWQPVWSTLWPGGVDPNASLVGGEPPVDLPTQEAGFRTGEVSYEGSATVVDKATGETVPLGLAQDPDFSTLTYPHETLEAGLPASASTWNFPPLTPEQLWALGQGLFNPVGSLTKEGVGVVTNWLEGEDAEALYKEIEKIPDEVFKGIPPEWRGAIETLVGLAVGSLTNVDLEQAVADVKSVVKGVGDGTIPGAFEAWINDKYVEIFGPWGTAPVPDQTGPGANELGDQSYVDLTKPGQWTPTTTSAGTEAGIKARQFTDQAAIDAGLFIESGVGLGVQFGSPLTEYTGDFVKALTEDTTGAEIFGEFVNVVEHLEDQSNLPAVTLGSNLAGSIGEALVFAGRMSLFLISRFGGAVDFAVGMGQRTLGLPAQGLWELPISLRPGGELYEQTPTNLPSWVDALPGGGGWDYSSRHDAGLGEYSYFGPSLGGGGTPHSENLAPWFFQGGYKPTRSLPGMTDKTDLTPAEVAALIAGYRTPQEQAEGQELNPVSRPPGWSRTNAEGRQEPQLGTDRRQTPGDPAISRVVPREMLRKVMQLVMTDPLNSDWDTVRTIVGSEEGDTTDAGGVMYPSGAWKHVDPERQAAVDAALPGIPEQVLRRLLQLVMTDPISGKTAIDAVLGLSDIEAQAPSPNERNR